MTSIQQTLLRYLLLLLVAAVNGIWLPGRANAQDVVSRTLTDAIYRGDGVINLLNDISGAQLAQYFNETGGLLMLGADVNEDNAGNESSTSLGIAIRQVQLSISTTAGDFTFSDFFTSTTAQLRQSGSTTASSYYTMFGQGGSSQLSGTTGFDLSSFDDVMWLENISLTGAVTRAELRVTFLETPGSRATAGESFFDFSGGFEDFALLSAADAALLEAANIGVAGAPGGLGYTAGRTVNEAIAAATPTPASNPAPSGSAEPPGAVDAPPGGGESAPVSPPAAPAPPWVFVAALAAIVAVKNFKRRQHVAN